MRDGGFRPRSGPRNFDGPREHAQGNLRRLRQRMRSTLPAHGR